MDRIDTLVAQWGKERPDLETGVMAEVARLLHVAQLIERRLDQAAADHGLDRGQADVLFTLRRAGAPFRLSPTALTDALLITSGTMTNRLDRLEAKGLVRRVPNPNDRRSMLVELTEEAREQVDRAVEVHVRGEHELMSALTARERAALQRILRKLATAMVEP